MDAPDLLGQLALSHGYLDGSSLSFCLHLQRRLATSGRPLLLGEILVARGLLDRAALESLLETQKKMRATQQAAGQRAGAPSDDLTIFDPQLLDEYQEAARKRAELKPPPEPAPHGARPDAEPLTRLGDYHLERCLSKGGMGTVYIARKDGQDWWVALKVLDPVGGSSPELLSRFRREADFLLSLNHPHIVAAHEVGTADGRHYLSMEYVQGEHLGSRMAREGVLDPLEALRMMRQVAEALRYAEESGLVHRDVKPQNVLIRQDGVVKLTDLGLAILANREDLRLTAPGSLVGTPAYMSPEHIQGSRDLDIRSDVYSLGCTFYHAICGRPPFEGQVVAVCQKHLHDEPPPPTDLRPELQPEIEIILLRCLEKNRGERYQSCAELISAIDLVLGSDAAGPAPGTGGTAGGRGPRRATDVEAQFGFSKPPDKPKPGSQPPGGPPRGASG